MLRSRPPRPGPIRAARGRGGWVGVANKQSGVPCSLGVQAMKFGVMFSSRPVRWLLALCLSLVLTACAGVGGPKMVNHAFNFDGWNDGWAIHGRVCWNTPTATSTPRCVARPKTDTAQASRSGVNGAMPVGEFLYVKWRLKATGEVVEERVDLQDRLPRDMTDHELTFVIDGRAVVCILWSRHKGRPRIVKQRSHKTWLSTLQRDLRNLSATRTKNGALNGTPIARDLACSFWQGMGMNTFDLRYAAIHLP